MVSHVDCCSKNELSSLTPEVTSPCPSCALCENDLWKQWHDHGFPSCSLSSGKHVNCLQWHAWCLRTSFLPARARIPASSDIIHVPGFDYNLLFRMAILHATVHDFMPSAHSQLPKQLPSVKVLEPVSSGSFGSLGSDLLPGPFRVSVSFLCSQGSRLSSIFTYWTSITGFVCGLSIRLSSLWTETLALIFYKALCLVLSGIG